MAGTILSGLASGLDWQTLVDKLIAADSVPVTNMQKQQARNSSIASALTDITSQFTAFKTQLSSDFSDVNFQQRLAASTTTNSTWKASSAPAGATGNYTFNVTSSASAAQQVGKSNVTGGINGSSDVSGLLISSIRSSQAITAGNFTVNGVQISVATTDTLKQVFDRISTATSGAVTAAYDPASDKVTLTGTGTISLGTSADTSNFLSALGLYQNGSSTVATPTTIGTSSTTVPLASSGLKTPITAVDGSGNGSFAINGTTISYNINTDSIASVLGKINNSAAGVTASYDSAQDRYTLTNNSTGNVSMFPTETGTGFLTATGLLGAGSSFKSGTNAVFTVNGGGVVTSMSNTLTAAVTGVAGLTLTVDAPGTQTIAVSSNIQDATTKINNMISKYNAIQSSIANYTKITVTGATGAKGASVTGAILSGNMDVQSISSQLRSIMFGSGSSLTGSVKNLSNLGIDFASTDPASLTLKDTTALSNALLNNGADVGAFFSDTTSGLSTRLTSFLTKQTSTTAALAVQTASMTTENDNLEQSIAALNKQLASERTLLTSSFIAMESASSKYQSQGAQLTSAFNNSSSSG